MVVLEVCLSERSSAQSEALHEAVKSLYRKQSYPVEGMLLDITSSAELRADVHHIRVCELGDAQPSEPQVVVHQLFNEEPAEEMTESGDGETVAFQMWELPAVEFDGLWESLLFEENVKEKLLRYVNTAMHFSELQ
eukprot:CAMPEP_0119326316 /NCGR_PEP_ID=MMETSP1333-20130426/68108_1 /TAXON_ID=418940 /ORGANISM="Scyphosphaera apsteinii, Strain RCC1455" /LENGTH=135 /DNA_ID=CAMNT_0007334599 /DNA_START=72 /DNA_END=476 /DNA_ORIENTATION=+